MLSGPTKSRDLHTSMNFVLDDALLDKPKAAPTNVAHVRVDIHEDLIPEFSPGEIFVFLNKLVCPPWTGAGPTGWTRATPSSARRGPYPG